MSRHKGAPKGEAITVNGGVDPRFVYGDHWENLSPEERNLIQGLGGIMRGQPDAMADTTTWEGTSGERRPVYHLPDLSPEILAVIAQKSAEGALCLVPSSNKRQERRTVYVLEDGEYKPGAIRDGWPELATLWSELVGVAQGRLEPDRLLRWINALAAEGRANASKPADPLWWAFSALLSTRPLDEGKSKVLACTQAQIREWMHRHFPGVISKGRGKGKSTLSQFLKRHGYKTANAKRPVKRAPK